MKCWRTLVSILVAVPVVAADCSEDDGPSSGPTDSGTENLEVGRYVSDDPGSVNTYWFDRPPMIWW